MRKKSIAIISLLPDITIIGQPGTGGTGPHLYSLVLLIPVFVTVRASAYKVEKQMVLLMKGKESVIYMSRD